ncbi:hypothetical protein [Agromyces bauzanensis]
MHVTSTHAGGFFDDEDAAAANRPTPEEFRPPAWMQAPDDELPERLLRDTVIARTEAAVVLLREVRVFSVGFEVHVEWFLRRRDGDHREWQQRTESAMRGPWRGGPGGPGERDTGLRFGLALADGRKVRAADLSLAMPGGTTPEPPTIMSRHGGGSGGDRTATGSAGIWVWAPDTPHGELTLVTEWAAAAIPITTTTLDGDEIADAVGRVRPLWDEPEA